MRSRAIGEAVSLLGAVLVAACGSTSLEILQPGVTESADGGVSGTAEAGTLPPEAGKGAPDAAISTDYCAGTGPPVLVASGEGGATSACIGGLAQSAFRWALCTCNGLVSSTSIATDSFNGAQGAYDAGAAQAGGALGTNGNLSAQGILSVGGALWASDPSGMTVETASAEGALHVAGPVASGPSLTVGSDAYVLGGLQASGNLAIAGTLYQPVGANLSVGGTKSVGATATSSFTVPPACDCDPALLIDVAAYVEAYRTTNDDAAGGIDSNALANVNTPTTLTIPCGQIFFTRVGGTAAINLALSAGRTAIFVGGDLSPNGPFSIDVPAGSEVDVFVEGGVVAGSSFTLGSAQNPANARLWVGGTATVNLPNASVIAGNVYAPRADLVLGTSPTTVFGSIFVNRLSAQGALTIHYDAAVLSAGTTCGAPAGPCSSCHDCGNQACVAGACGACTDSSECCAPLLCSGGTCVDVIP